MSTDANSDGSRHAGGHGGGPEQLVRMANDIGHFFRAEPEREVAIAEIANHIDKFWTKRMRDKLQKYLDGGGDMPLDELPREAVKRLSAQRTAAVVIATLAPAVAVPRD
jgi:formate dehydrogenase subunit delta